MATIRAYTTIEQSRKLAKILPLESADMLWGYYYGGIDYCVPNIRPFRDMHDNIPKGYTPAWSLEALLDVLPKIINNETLFIETSAALWHIGYRNIYTARADNPVDACYELILKLHKLNLL